MKRADYTLAGVLVAVAGFFFYESFFFQQALVGDNQLGEVFFPRLLAVLLAALSLGLVYTTWKRGGDEGPAARIFAKSALPLCTVLLLGIYLFSLEPLGFLVSTAILNCILMFLFGVRNIPVLALFSVLLTSSTYVIFAKLLLVPLPEGIFYF